MATHTIDVLPVGNFTDTVTLSAATPSSGLILSLEPTSIDPPGQARLTVQDTNPDAASLSGIWYHIPITATGGDLTSTTGVNLLVGGARFYLPIVF